MLDSAMSWVTHYYGLVTKDWLTFTIFIGVLACIYILLVTVSMLVGKLTNSGEKERDVLAEAQAYLDTIEYGKPLTPLRGGNSFNNRITSMDDDAGDKVISDLTTFMNQVEQERFIRESNDDLFRAMQELEDMTMSDLDALDDFANDSLNESMNSLDFDNHNQF